MLKFEGNYILRMSTLLIQSPYQEIIDFINKLYNICKNENYDEISKLYERNNNFNNLCSVFYKNADDIMAAFRNTHDENLIKYLLDMIKYMESIFAELHELCKNIFEKTSLSNNVKMVNMFSHIRVLRGKTIYLKEEIYEIQGIIDDNPTDIKDVFKF